jgi:hypothetical protein
MASVIALLEGPERESSEEAVHCIARHYISSPKEHLVLRRFLPEQLDCLQINKRC